MNLHDIYGTPFNFTVVELQDGELVEVEILLNPPTVKYFESLLSTYNIGLDDVIANTPGIEEEVALVNLMSKTLKMLHIAAALVDPSIDYNRVENWFAMDPTVVERFLKQFSAHLPSNKAKGGSGRRVVNPKVKTQPKTVWIPK